MSNFNTHILLIYRQMIFIFPYQQKKLLKVKKIPKTQENFKKEIKNLKLKKRNQNLKKA